MARSKDDAPGERRVISVCLASYNGAETIGRQIASILPQLGEKDELIVSDDGSTDDTRGIVAAIARADARVKLIDGPGRGVIANFGHAIGCAVGEYVYLSDQDDVWMPDKVLRVQAAFAAGGCAVVVHDARVVDGNGGVLVPSFFKRHGSAPGLWRNILRNSYMGCCMAFRSDRIPLVLPIPRSVCMHDQWIGILCERRGGSAFLNAPLIDYYRHGRNASPQTHLPVPRMVRNRAALVLALFKRLCLWPASRSDLNAGG